MPTEALGLRLWLSGIVIYNVVSGVLAILNPSVLDALFPGSAAVFGRESTMLSRVLGSYALSIGNMHTYDVRKFLNFFYPLPPGPYSVVWGSLT